MSSFAQLLTAHFGPEMPQTTNRSCNSNFRVTKDLYIDVEECFRSVSLIQKSIGEFLRTEGCLQIL